VLAEGFCLGSVWAGDDLEVMAVHGVFPVNAPAAVVVVDLAGDASGGVSPVV
jgi:hypothetical protein